MEEPKFVISDSGIIIFSTGAQTHMIGPEHPNHSEIMVYLKKRRWITVMELAPEMPDEMKRHIAVYLDTFDLDGAL